MREQSSLKGSGSQESASESRKRRVQKSKETHSEEEVAAEEVAAEEVEAEEVEAEDSETNEPDSGPFGEGSAIALEDGSAPGSEYIIKGKTSTKIYHPEESSFYGRTKADVWFTNSETAENAGFRLPNSMQKGSEEITEESEMEKHDDGNDEENA